MIKSSPEKAILNIFERAAKSLSETRDKLDKTRKLLKKSIHRLSTFIQCDNDEVAAILNDIKNSVSQNIDLNVIDSQLDKLFIVSNNSEGLKNTTYDKAFYSTLKTSLGEMDCSDACIALVNGFADSKLSDKKISLELLKLLNQTHLDHQDQVKVPLINS